MRRQLTGGACVLAILTMVACAAPAPAGPTNAEMIAAADALDDRFIAALNAGDAEALAAMYTGDAISFPPDAMEARGREAILAASKTMAEGMAGARFELIDQRNDVVGSVVIGWGLWRMTMTGPDGAQVQVDGRYSDVKVNHDGQWLYMIDHASVPMPPPPAG